MGNVLESHYKEHCCSSLVNAVASEELNIRRQKNVNQQMHFELQIGRRLISSSRCIVNFGFRTDSFVKLYADSPLEDTYSVSVELGRGSFGTVWEARHRYCRNYRVAVKSWTRVYSQDSKASTTFLKERDTLVFMEHPNVVKLFEAWKQQQHLVTELCHGGELYGYVSKLAMAGKNMKERNAKVYMYQMSLAVAYLHSHRIVHRDIKTENWLFLFPPLENDTSNTTTMLKLCDFGTAVRLGSSNVSTRVGTLSYTAPEIYNNQGANLRSDVWSLGVCLYVMLCGRSPFRRSPSQPIENADSPPAKMTEAQRLSQQMSSSPRKPTGPVGSPRKPNAPPDPNDGGGAPRGSVGGGPGPREVKETIQRIRQGQYDKSKIQGCSKGARDLVAKLVNIVDVQRPPANEIATDPWIQTGLVGDHNSDGDSSEGEGNTASTVAQPFVYSNAPIGNDTSHTPREMKSFDPSNKRNPQLPSSSSTVADSGDGYYYSGADAVSAAPYSAVVRNQFTQATPRRMSEISNDEDEAPNDVMRTSDGSYCRMQSPTKKRSDGFAVLTPAKARSHLALLLRLLMVFGQCNGFQRMALVACARTTPDEAVLMNNLLPWYRLFNFFDGDRDGKLAVPEFVHKLTKLFVIHCPEAHDHAQDPAHNHSENYTSIANRAEQVQASLEHQLLPIVKCLDTDHNGFISWSQWLALERLTQRKEVLLQSGEPAFRSLKAVFHSEDTLQQCLVLRNMASAEEVCSLMDLYQIAPVERKPPPDDGLQIHGDSTQDTRRVSNNMPTMPMVQISPLKESDGGPTAVAYSRDMRASKNTPLLAETTANLPSPCLEMGGPLGMCGNGDYYVPVLPLRLNGMFSDSGTPFNWTHFSKFLDFSRLEAPAITAEILRDITMPSSTSPSTT